MQVVTGPTKSQTKYGWLCTLLEWTNITCHDLITRNLWPKPETTNNQELNTMPVHEKNGVQRATLGTPPKIQRSRKLGEIHQQNKQHQDQYLPLQQPIYPVSATTHTDQRTSSQK
jgi:hypothetical protein